ncbi:MMPL family transporter [Cryptosporangium phraense]|uniref:MMPL family transporter n=1 Tax=Cryptosporangium phraense TaxID=2593070 RepID=A0A545AIC1_9ACTN|nr:MMPL family transporter [Cryptosporangium phraense]TQS41063.1 MMPL family transporter [Cryptosporangium phraense]
MAGLLYRLGVVAYRRRILMSLGWLLVLAAVGVGAATLSGSTVNTFSIPGQESTTALDRIGERFGSAANGASAQVVFQTSGPITGAATEVAAAVTRLNGLPGVVSATNPLDPASPVVSRDRRAAYSTVTYAVPATDLTSGQREALLAAVSSFRSDRLDAEVTGEASQAQGGDVGGPAEAGGVVVALVVLAITYGSLVAAGMNLLTALVGVGIGALGITALTGFVELQATTPVLAIMLGLAVGIDYALFLFTRFRHELVDGRAVREAVPMAVGTAGSAVVTAGLTVVIALAGLSVAGIPFLTEMGLAAAGTIVVAVLIAVTLVPAVLALIGVRALPRRKRASRGFVAGWARLVTSRAWICLGAAIVVLGVIAIPVASMRTSLNQPAPEDSTQARAASIISARFGPGFTGPLLILADGPDAVAVAKSAMAAVRDLDGVAVVAGPNVNGNGDAALVSVIPSSGPDAAATVALVHSLRSALSRVGGSASLSVTGATAVSVDVSQKLSEALPQYLVLVVGLALVLLILVFRSLLVPVTGVLGFLLTIGAALGATTAVFQWGWLSAAVNADVTGPLLSLSPIIVVGILFGLAMDYQVFLVSRMHEAHAHGLSPRSAVVTGFRQAAPVVVAAASIMFAVFAGFIPQGDETIKPIAFALATGILFDAIVVRMIAMPAALTLLGSAAWWLPSWLRWLPAVDVEGAALEREPVKTPEFAHQ